jgi:pimeloyl-ACP methyl ester carboxylesterase
MTDTSGPTRRTLLAGAAALAAAPVIGRPDAALAAPPRPATGKPTIVLVHGAWADAGCWAQVVRRLHDRGYQVLATANPLRGLAADSAYLAAVLQQHTTGPVVLVGHSYGGAVVTNAALFVPTVEALVYVNAFVPDTGDTILGLLGGGGDPAALFDFVQVQADIDLYVKPALFPSLFAADLATPHATVLAAGQRPVTFGALQEPSGAPAWRSRPSWYVRGTQDAILPPAAQLTMAQRAGSTVVDVAAGHLSMLSRPAVVESTILAAVRAIR